MAYKASICFPYIAAESCLAMLPLAVRGKGLSAAAMRVNPLVKRTDSMHDLFASSTTGHMSSICACCVEKFVSALLPAAPSESSVESSKMRKGCGRPSPPTRAHRTLGSDSMILSSFTACKSLPCERFTISSAQPAYAQRSCFVGCLVNRSLV